MLSWPLEITITHIKYNLWNITGIHQTQNALRILYNERKNAGAIAQMELTETDPPSLLLGSLPIAIWGEPYV
jgi:hypothetical protein